MPSFKEYMQNNATGWLQGPNGRSVMRGLGDVKDSLVTRTRDGVKSRFPSFSSRDGLGVIGDERQLLRGSADTDADYASRLKSAWELWPWAGTARGLLRAFHDVGYTNVALAIFNRRLYTMDGSKQLVTTVLAEHSWLFAGVADTFWSKFAVLFPEPLPDAWVSDGVPADDSDEANTIRSIIKKWKPGHMTCAGIHIATSPETWDYFPEGGTWDDPGATWADETTWTTWSP